MRRAERGAMSLMVMVSSVGVLGACVMGQLQPRGAYVPHRVPQRQTVQQPTTRWHATETFEDALRCWHVARQSL